LFPCDTTIIPDPTETPEEKDKAQAQANTGFKIITKDCKESAIPTKSVSFVIKNKPV
jgi:hypothetical protein